MLLAVDVGNSAVKLGLFDGEALRRTARLEVGAATLPDEFRAADRAVAVSVSARGLAWFEELWDDGLGVLGRDLPLHVENRYRVPEEVGRDRLVNAAAAFALVRGPAVVADLGSAVTVDAVSAEGAFLGGAIAPGLPSLAAGLRAAAPALPAWDGEGPGEDLPRSTAEALRAGLVLGLAGALDRLAAEVGREVPGAAVVLTGGDAARLAPRLTVPHLVEPNLTLRGVVRLAARTGGGA